MKRSVKEVLIRLAILLGGLIIAHLGVTLFLLSDLGSDPFNVLIQGLFRTLDKAFDFSLLTHGNVHICVCCLIIVILLFTNKSYIKLGTLLCMICGGPIIDLFTFLLTPIFVALPQLYFKFIMLAAGCVILAFGMTLVIRSDAGTGPNDLVAVVIADKLKKKFGIIRVIVDLVFTGIGLLLGGKAGVGTVVAAFLVGPVAGFFLPVSGRIVDRVLKKALKA